MFFGLLRGEIIVKQGYYKKSDADVLIAILEISTPGKIDDLQLKWGRGDVYFLLFCQVPRHRG